MSSVVVILALLAGALPASAGPDALHPLGGLFIDPAEVPWLVEVRPDATLADPPPSVDHSADMPPVGSQGSLPSCTSWAFAYYYKTYQEWLERGWDVNDTAHQFSPTFLYNMANAGGNIGSYYTDNMRLLVDFGCATFADCPNSANPVPWPSETAYVRALPFRCQEACYISCGSDPGIVALKQHIADGDNAVLPINVWGNFDDINSYDTCYCSVDRTGTNRGGHYITFVGYDDDRPTHDGPGAFRLVNSWGTGWGNGGYAWMSYAAVKDAQLSYRIGLFLVDRIGYTPRLVTRARLEHDSREDVLVDAGIRENGMTVWSKEFFDRDLERQGGHPFPAHDIPFDLTDGADSLRAGDTNSVYLECCDNRADGISGELVDLTGVDHDWGMRGRTSVTRVPIPDDGSPAGTAFSLPGQELHWPGFMRFPAHTGATELAAELDTLRLACSFQTGGPVSAAPVLGDVDGDGRNEVVFGSEDDTVRVLNGESGSVLWTGDASSGIEAAPALGDLDGDGLPEIVTGAVDGTIRAWDGLTGTPLWTCELSSAPAGGLLVADPDNDGRLEVVCGTQDGKVAALNGEDGSPAWSSVLPGAVLGAPALGDVDSDGRLEVVVGVADSVFRVLDAETGTPRFASVAGAAGAAPALADLDADGSCEVVVGSDDGYLRCYAGNSGAVSWEFDAGVPVRSCAAVGDLWANEGLEVVFGLEDSTVSAFGADGALLWRNTVGGAVVSSPALGRVDGDSVLDVIIGAGDGRLYVLSGSDGAIVCSRPTGGAIRSSAAAGDIDGGGYLDVAVGSDDGRLYVFGGAQAGLELEPGAGMRPGFCLDVQPNPAAGSAVACVSAPAGSVVELRLFDASGRLVRQVRRATPAGRLGPVGLRLTGLAGGSYFLVGTARSGSGVETAVRQFVLVR